MCNALQKIAAWVVATIFGVIMFGFIVFVIGQTIDTAAERSEQQHVEQRHG